MCIVLCNLKAKPLAGYNSHGMVLCAETPSRDSETVHKSNNECLKCRYEVVPADAKRVLTFSPAIITQTMAKVNPQNFLTAGLILAKSPDFCRVQPHEFDAPSVVRDTPSCYNLSPHDVTH